MRKLSYSLLCLGLLALVSACATSKEKLTPDPSSAWAQRGESMIPTISRVNKSNTSPVPALSSQKKGATP